MEDKKLYSTKEISKIYSIKVSTINSWRKKGMSGIRGERNGYLYKKEWIDEYIELNSNNSISINNKDIKVSHKNRLAKNCTMLVH